MHKLDPIFDIKYAKNVEKLYNEAQNKKRYRITFIQLEGLKHEYDMNLTDEEINVLKHIFNSDKKSLYFTDENNIIKVINSQYVQAITITPITKE